VHYKYAGDDDDNDEDDNDTVVCNKCL